MVREAIHLLRDVSTYIEQNKFGENAKSGRFNLRLV